MSFAQTSANEMLITTYLEMTSEDDFSPGYVEADDIRIATIDADVSFYRYLYKAVGEKWAWRDRTLLTDEELHGILSDHATSVHVLFVNNVPAGYIELNHQGDCAEIAYFGLRSEFHGRGLGKHLLSFGVENAWKMGIERLWLHTCNLDGPHALNNYKKRGFSVFKIEHEPMPELYSKAS